MRGDFAGAQRAQEVVMRFEDLAEVASPARSEYPQNQSDVIADRDGVAVEVIAHLQRSGELRSRHVQQERE